MTSFVRCSTPDCIGVAEKVGDRKPYCALCSGIGPLLPPDADRKVFRHPADSGETRRAVADVDGAYQGA